MAIFDHVSAFVAYLVLFRLGIIGAGIISIVLGYRLFCRGVWPSGRGTSVNANVGGSQFTLKNAAPGTCFALFGVVLISVMLTASSPEVIVESMREPVSIEPEASDTAKIGRARLELRGIENAELQRAISRGAFYERNAKDTALAIGHYQRGVDLMSAVIANLGWLYLTQGKVESALVLSQAAALIAPEEADILAVRAEILLQNGEWPEALKLMKRAAGLDSKYRLKLERLEETIRQADNPRLGQGMGER